MANLKTVVRPATSGGMTQPTVQPSQVFEKTSTRELTGGLTAVIGLENHKGKTLI